MRILIVEDEEALALGLKFNFEQEGYEVLLAGDGPTALKLFEDTAAPVDLIIMDLMLPGMSGYEICKAIREQNKTIPILVLSARTLSEDRMHAFDCGTDQYMTKPFVLPELLNRVRNLLERHKTLLAAAASNGLDATFFSVKISDLMSRYYGDSPKLVQALYEEARFDTEKVLDTDWVNHPTLTHLDAPEKFDIVLVNGKVLTVDVEAATAGLVEGQRKRLATVSQRDWAGRDADALSPPVYGKKDRLPQQRPVT